MVRIRFPPAESRANFISPTGPRDLGRQGRRAEVLMAGEGIYDMTLQFQRCHRQQGGAGTGSSIRPDLHPRTLSRPPVSCRSKATASGSRAGAC